jgi:hypothetical protein
MAWLLALPTNYLIGMLLWLVAGVLAFWGLLKYRQRLRRSGRRLTLANLLFSLWIFLAMLTGVEVYFALLFDATDSFNRSNISRVWFLRHVEPDLRVLDLGHGGIKYRDDQIFPRPVPEDRKHVCFVGDSFTFGHGVASVSDRFSNRIRAELDSRFPHEYIITNLSEPGTDLNWAEGLVRELVENDIHVDTLVYVFCPNDIEVYHPDFMKNVQKLSELNPNCPLLAHTYFFNLLYYRYQLASRPEAREYYGYLADYYSGEPWQQMQTQFKAFAAFCKAYRIELKVVIFPFLQDLDQESPFDHARSVVRGFCDEQGIPVLDLHETLSEHAQENLTVSVFDAHPNARAHNLAADAILPFLFGD